jgi:hypothetical protein
MKKLQILTLAMLLGSVYEMYAAPSGVKLNKSTAALPNISIVNKSNMSISVAVNVSRSGDGNGNVDRASNVIEPGASNSINSFVEGDEVKTLTVTYYKAGGKNALDSKNIEISGEDLLKGPANNKQGIMAQTIYVYGDSSADAGALSKDAKLPSRFIAYWMDKATAGTETASAKQPVTMYCLSIDGKFTTMPF